MNTQKRENITKIGVAIFTFSAYLIFLQAPVQADETTTNSASSIEVTQISTNNVSDAQNISTSASAVAVVSADSAAISSSNTVASEASVGSDANSQSVSNSSSVNSSGVVTTTDLGNTENQSEIELAKQSAASAYTTTGVAQVVTASAAASVTPQAAF